MIQDSKHPPDGPGPATSNAGQSDVSRQPDEPSTAATREGAEGSQVGVSSEPSSPTPPKSQEVASLIDLLRYAYSRQGQRVSTAAISNEVAANLKFDATVDGELRVLARQDRLLRVPWQLFAAVLRANTDEALVRKIAEIVAVAVQEHPVIQPVEPRPASVPDVDEQVSADTNTSLSTALRAIVRSLETCRDGGHGLDQDSAETALAAAASLPESHIEQRLSQYEDGVARDVTDFRTNLVNTMALLFATLLRWPQTLLASLLYENLWRPRAVVASDKPLLLLTNNPDPDVISQVVDIWTSYVSDAEQRAVEARRDTERLDRHAKRLQAHVDELQNERLDLKVELDRLGAAHKELETQLSDRERHLGETRAHASHDYETLRTSAIQRATRELELLQEGLHALTRDQPKAHVTKDRLERAIEGLEKELRQLRGGDRG